MNKVDVIVGLSFGDEGKGKIINELCKDYDINVRYAGGANSGHKIWVSKDDSVVFNVIPSGMINPHVIGVLTQGVVINPTAFREEFNRVVKYAPNLKDRLILSGGIHITTPTHILMDILSEKARVNSGVKSIGSTNRGNTPTYTDKVSRRGITIDTLRSMSFKDAILKLEDAHAKELISKYDLTIEDITGTEINGIPYQQYASTWMDDVMWLADLNISNTVEFLHNQLFYGKKILVEGAQGCMLDLDYGTYPFCTSSSVTAVSGLAQCGIPAQCLGRVFGVFKGYITRVGNGFFPSEIDEESPAWPTACHIVEKGREFGSVTGRRRKIGWLDLPQLKYACSINGVTDLVLMKTDILSDIPNDFGVVTSYEYLSSNPNMSTNSSDMYLGEYGFVESICKFFPRLDTEDRLWYFINYINGYVGSVVSKPRISYISSDPVKPSMKV